MQLTVQDNTISNMFSGNNMSINITPKMFEMLSSGVYTNSIAAVIREPITNAHDSHIEAGTTHVPFEVYLPTALDPVYRIKDYGTGVSPDKIHDVYTYGLSGKEHSNLFNGALGIGAKSPYAYTDTFTVKTRWEGKQYTFLAFKKDGFPQLSSTPISITDTDEANGLEVEIPVKSKDFSRFKAEAIKILSVCDLSVKFKLFDGDTDIAGDVLRSNYKIIGTEIADNVHVVKSNDCKRGIYIVMQNVAYYCDIYKLPEIPYVFGHRGEFNRSTLFITVPNGTVMFNNGREELDYDHELTVQCLKQLSDNIDTYWKNYVSWYYNAMLDYADTTCIDEYTTLSKLTSALNISLASDSCAFTWNEKRIQSLTALNISSKHKIKWRMNKPYKRGVYAQCRNGSICFNNTTEKQPVVVHTGNAHSAKLTYCKDKHIQQSFTQIKCNNNNQTKALVRLLSKLPHNLQIINLDDVDAKEARKYVNSLNKPTQSDNTNTDLISIVYLTPNGNKFTINTSPDSIPTDKKCVYIVSSNGHYTFNHSMQYLYTYHDLARLYIIPKSYVSKFKKVDNWIHFDDWFKTIDYNIDTKHITAYLASEYAKHHVKRMFEEQSTLTRMLWFAKHPRANDIHDVTSHLIGESKYNNIVSFDNVDNGECEIITAELSRSPDTKYKVIQTIANKRASFVVKDIKKTLNSFVEKYNIPCDEMISVGNKTFYNRRSSNTLSHSRNRHIIHKLLKRGQ